MTLAPRVQVFTQLACDLDPPAQNINLISPPMAPLNGSVGLLDPPIAFAIPESKFTPYIAHKAPYEQCLKDPTVQSKASQLQTCKHRLLLPLPSNLLISALQALLTTMGVLSAITTGWWGRFGEKHGRLTVLSFSTVGLLVT